MNFGQVWRRKTECLVLFRRSDVVLERGCCCPVLGKNPNSIFGYISRLISHLNVHELTALVCPWAIDVHNHDWVSSVVPVMTGQWTYNKGIFVSFMLPPSIIAELVITSSSQFFICYWIFFICLHKHDSDSCVTYIHICRVLTFLLNKFCLINYRLKL